MFEKTISRSRYVGRGNRAVVRVKSEITSSLDVCRPRIDFDKRARRIAETAHARATYVRARTRRVRVFSKAARAPVYHFITVMGETTRATDAAITVATANDASGCYTTGDNRWLRHFAVRREYPKERVVLFVLSSPFRPRGRVQKDSKL